MLARLIGVSQLGLTAFLAVHAAAALAAAPADRPNIVFILADDLAWNDLRCYGHEWHDTPHLDRLASQGMRFTQGYAAAPICSASRAALLTGRSPARLGFEFVTKEPGSRQENHALEPPPFTLDLPLDEVTLAEALGGAGYATGIFGKWHVSQHNDVYLGWSTTHGPRQQGFAEGRQDFGSHPYSDEASPQAPTALPRGDYGRDALTERAIDFVRAHRNEPFFLYLSHYYVHTPVRTRAAWLREKYLERLHDGIPQRCAEYAAMVETLDHLAGQVLAALDDLALSDRTLVVFTSDNGGHPEYAANGPLRGSKWNLYEGGIRVPWIVRWPGHVAANSICETPIIGYDLFPTLCDAASVEPPQRVALDGTSLLPVLRGEAAIEPDRALVWHFPYYHPERGFDRAIRRIGVDDFVTSQTRPHSAIRRGDYKLVHFYESGGDELYRLSADEAEQNDLSTSNPERAGALRRELDDYLRAVEARTPVASSPPRGRAEPR